MCAPESALLAAVCRQCSKLVSSVCSHSLPTDALVNQRGEPITECQLLCLATLDAGLSPAQTRLVLPPYAIVNGLTAEELNTKARSEQKLASRCVPAAWLDRIAAERLGGFSAAWLDRVAAERLSSCSTALLGRRCVPATRTWPAHC